MLLAQMSTGSVSAQRLPLLLLKSTTDAPCTQASTRMSSPRRLTRRKIEFSRLSRSRPQWEPVRTLFTLSSSQTHTEFSPAVATVRSQSLGISYGTGKSIENALNTFKPDGDPAWDALDFAVFAARQ
jgi:hypothetical protein